MNDKVKNLLIRTASGIALLAVFTAATLWSAYSFSVLLFVIAIGCQVEFYALCRKGGASPQYVTGLFFGLLLLLFGIGFTMLSIIRSTGEMFMAASLMLPSVLLMILMPATIFICQLWRKTPDPVTDIATTFAGVLYAALPMSLLMLVPPLLCGGTWDGRTMLGYIFVIWSNDVFAYLTGCTFGRHKMCERLSPKKSWEGFAGGIAGAVLTGWIVSLWLEGSAAVWCGLAGVTAVTGVAGDLAESMFKRRVGVKDSGRIMPGHGGMLDRFDSLLISTPFAVVYLLLLHM